MKLVLGPLVLFEVSSFLKHVCVQESMLNTCVCVCVCVCVQESMLNTCVCAGKHAEQAGPQSIAAANKDKAGMLKVVLSQAVLGQTSSHDVFDKGRPESRTTDRPESMMEEFKK